MAAGGLIDFDELRARLAALEETRETARPELAALKGRRENSAELERDRDALMESYAGLVPEALKALSPEERHNVYKPLKLRANLSANDTLELSGALDRGVAAVSKNEAAPRAVVRDSFPLTSRAFDAEEASPRGGRKPKTRTQSTSRAK